MTGLNGQRVYLDWNATAPLRPEARTAMLEVMDVVGNPSSVHAEGRAAKAMIEKARGQVAALVACDPDEVVFTSGATEANNLVLKTFDDGPFIATQTEHDSVWAIAGHLHETHDASDTSILVDSSGQPQLKLATDLVKKARGKCSRDIIYAFSTACGETGVVRSPEVLFEKVELAGWDIRLVDATQSVGKIAVPHGSFVRKAANALPHPNGRYLATHMTLSGHKIGGPKGTGALLMHPDCVVSKQSGGGQEKGVRSGTENVIGIVGFGAAAEAAQRDLEAGVWDQVEKLRDTLEYALASAAPDTIFFGKEGPRLPNTSCFAVPGWAGETQVMQMDLAGFAVSAGSACSSGKVNKASRVLLAMGFDELTASSAIRVSMGPTTTEAEVLAFADAWIDQYRRRKARAA